MIHPLTNEENVTAAGPWFHPPTEAKAPHDDTFPKLLTSCATTSASSTLQLCSVISCVFPNVKCLSVQICTCRTLDNLLNGAFDKSQEYCSPNNSVCLIAVRCLCSRWLKHAEINTIPALFLLSVDTLCSVWSINRPNGLEIHSRAWLLSGAVEESRTRNSVEQVSGDSADVECEDLSHSLHTSVYELLFYEVEAPLFPSRWRSSWHHACKITGSNSKMCDQDSPSLRTHSLSLHTKPWG